MTPNPSAPTGTSLLERLNERFGRRTVGIVAAIAAELLIVLLLLTLGRGEPPPPPPLQAVTAFDVSAPQPEQERAAQEPAQPEPAPAAQPPAPARPAEPAPPRPTPAITLPDMPVVQPSAAPQPQPSTPPTAQPAPQTRTAPAVRKGAMQGPMLGASASGASNDTPVVGTAPDGEPLYAARWYREPTDQELAGYLSTASGPGWGLIACKTAPQFRVEGCVPLSESPQGSNMNRAILAAAWQFRVRPPRVGGRYLVGSWVRIRIDYLRRGA